MQVQVRLHRRCQPARRDHRLHAAVVRRGSRQRRRDVVRAIGGGRPSRRHDPDTDPQGRSSGTFSGSPHQGYHHRAAGTPSRRRTRRPALRAGPCGTGRRPPDLARLYTVDPHTGHAVGIGTAVALDGHAIGFDFNPTVDRIRLVTSKGQNLRLHPDTGAVAATDGVLAHVDGGSAPRVAAAGYTNSVAGATSTTLYAIDSEPGRD
ncbi:DUF4394 domain-containing protein [Saccharothrix stipae]